MWQYFTILTVALVTVPTNCALHTLNSMYEFKELDYDFPAATLKQLIDNKTIVPGNGVPIDVDVFYHPVSKVRTTFVTVPKFINGIPFSIATIIYVDGKPKLSPYPDYSWHSSQGSNCNNIISVFRIAIDRCNRLWVLDTGRIGDNQLCPPKVLCFNLMTNALILKHEFSPSIYKPGVSLFITIIADVRSTCEDVMVYIADVTGFGIVILNPVTNVSWRAQNKRVFPCPEPGTYTILGQSFDLMDGIFGLSVSPRTLEYSKRNLYFHALASYQENSVPLSILDNRTMWLSNVESSPQSFVTIGNRVTQSAAQAMDSKGNIFFGLISSNAVACWDSKTTYNSTYTRVVAQNDTTLQFASGVKIVKNLDNNDELWVSTCRFQRIMTGTKNSNEVNYRIQGDFVSTLLDGCTSCNPKSCF